MKALKILAIIAGIGTFGVCAFCGIGYWLSKSSGPPQPGEAEFRTASSKIMSYSSTAAFGNSKEAIEMASAYSDALKNGREVLFKGGKESKLAFAKGHFLVYCELRGDRCAFLVHVPELRQYTSEARKIQADFAWLLARSILRKNYPNKEMKLAIGLRGAVLYGPVLVGQLAADDKDESEPTKSLDGDGHKAELYPFFAAEAPQGTGKEGAGTGKAVESKKTPSE